LVGGGKIRKRARQKCRAVGTILIEGNTPRLAAGNTLFICNKYIYTKMIFIAPSILDAINVYYYAIKQYPDDKYIKKAMICRIGTKINEQYARNYPDFNLINDLFDFAKKNNLARYVASTVCKIYLHTINKIRKSLPENMKTDSLNQIFKYSRKIDHTDLHDSVFRSINAAYNEAIQYALRPKQYNGNLFKRLLTQAARINIVEQKISTTISSGIKKLLNSSKNSSFNHIYDILVTAVCFDRQFLCQIINYLYYQNELEFARIIMFNSKTFGKIYKFTTNFKGEKSIDLHGYSYGVVYLFLEWVGKKNITNINFITGSGKHSQQFCSKTGSHPVKSALIDFANCNSLFYKYCPNNSGIMMVDFTKKKQSSLRLPKYCRPQLITF
jgi:hypothetical protein